MRVVKFRTVLMALACVGLSSTVLAEVAVRPMNLADMSQNADRIFRGTVLDVTQASVTGGGGEIPIVVYQVRVDEALKGTFPPVKEGSPVVEIRMVGRLKELPPRDDGFKRISVLTNMPKLKVGKEYLLLSTRPSAAGLSTTVGLGQGCFSIFVENKVELAANEHDNLGLFKGMDDGGVPTPGPIPYSTLADRIRDLVGAGE